MRNHNSTRVTTLFEFMKVLTDKLGEVLAEEPGAAESVEK
jgi:hypothetical protein